MQSQGFRVVLTHQNSPEVTSFVTFGTPLRTVKMPTNNSGGYDWSQRITRFRSLALFPIPRLRQVTLALEEGGSRGFPVPRRPGQTTSGFPRAAMERTRPRVSAVSPRPLVDLPQSSLDNRLRTGEKQAMKKDFDPAIGKPTRWQKGQPSPNPGGVPEERSLPMLSETF